MADNTTFTATGSADSGTTGTSFGKVVYDSTAITAADSTRIVTGFKPRYVAWENATDRTKIEWYEGMADNTCIKTVAAGTRTLETSNGGITVDSQGFRVLQNATLAAVLASKTCYYRAEA